MNRIETTNIATGQALPLNADRLDYIQDNVEAIPSELLKGLISYSTNDLIVMRGCVVTGSNPTYNITAGCIYYNGIFYLVDADTITATTPQIPVWSIDKSYADTGSQATFSNGFIASVEAVFKLKLISGFSGSGLADYNASTVKPFNVSTSDRQHASASPGSMLVPSGGTGGPDVIAGASLTTAAGLKRKYKLEFTWSFNQVTTTPEMAIGFYKNGTLLFEFIQTAIPINGHKQANTIHMLDDAVGAGTVYDVRIRNTSGTDQYNITSFFFSIDGQA